MSGAFYGSLATSASVFVAILTALLVNTYVQIKSDRRHTKNELNRIEEDLKGVRERRDDYQDTVDSLVEKREADYKEKAEEQVDEFIESEILSEIAKPIEQLSVDELYQELINFHDCESAEDLEDSSINYHHRDILKERIDEIENQILKEIIPPFALRHQKKGSNSNSDPDATSLDEKLAEMRDDQEEISEVEVEEQSEEDNDGSDIEAEAEARERNSLDLDEFIDKYKEEFDLNSLDDKTKEELEAQYDDIVDKNPKSGSSPPATTDSHDTDPFGPLRRQMEGAVSALSQVEESNPLLEDSNLAEINSVLGLSAQEKQKLGKVREDLQDKENEIEILKQRQSRLKREKERLHPEDLVPTLVANVATIILSVVIPIITYLVFVTDSAFKPPDWLWIISHTEVNVFLSWFLGLCVVFESIYARINDREPKAYRFYQWIR